MNKKIKVGDWVKFTDYHCQLFPHLKGFSFKVAKITYLNSTVNCELTIDNSSYKEWVRRTLEYHNKLRKNNDPVDETELGIRTIYSRIVEKDINKTISEIAAEVLDE